MREIKNKFLITTEIDKIVSIISFASIKKFLAV